MPIRLPREPITIQTIQIEIGTAELISMQWKKNRAKKQNHTGDWEPTECQRKIWRAGNRRWEWSRENGLQRKGGDAGIRHGLQSGDAREP